MADMDPALRNLGPNIGSQTALQITTKLDRKICVIREIQIKCFVNSTKRLLPVRVSNGNQEMLF